MDGSDGYGVPMGHFWKDVVDMGSRWMTSGRKDGYGVVVDRFWKETMEMRSWWVPMGGRSGCGVPVGLLLEGDDGDEVPVGPSGGGEVVMGSQWGHFWKETMEMRSWWVPLGGRSGYRVPVGSLLEGDDGYWAVVGPSGGEKWLWGPGGVTSGRRWWLWGPGGVTDGKS